MKHVHIVGMSPRTGTTLMSELMINCFEFDGWPRHEQSIFLAPTPKVARLCSKNPSAEDVEIAAMALRKSPARWNLAMVSDPRDVMGSRHKLKPDMYWTSLGRIRPQVEQLMAAMALDRVVVVKYEDLVTYPDAVQKRLMAQIDFLEKRADFSQFSTLAKPSHAASRALGGVRPISTASVWNWKQHLPRIKGQIERYGYMTEMLRVLDYETDLDWTSCLECITGDHSDGFTEHRDLTMALHRRLVRDIRSAARRTRFRLGYPAKALKPLELAAERG